MVEVAAHASSLAEQGRFADAVSLYKIAVSKQPERASLHEQLSQCLLETEQYAEAYAAAVQACSLKPEGMDSSNQAAAEELAEVRQLQQQQLTLRIGIPNLQIDELQGAENGPGHVIWEAGIVLSRYLVNHRELVQSKKVLELGCGTGIVGITAACLGARAFLTDIEAVVQHAQHNVDCNVSSINDGQGSAECAALDWEASLNSSPLLRPYDVVVGADLIYAAKDIGPLVETLGNLRQHSRDVLIILAHKERNLDILQQLIAQLSVTGIAMQTMHKAGAISLYTTE